MVFFYFFYYIVFICTLKYLFGMKNDIIYVFDILLMAIYNEIKKRKEDGRDKRYIWAFTKT